VVNADATVAAMVSAPNPSTIGQSVTLTATITAAAPGSGTPAGTVQFFDGGTLLATAPATATLAGGTASATFTFTTPNLHPLTTGGATLASGRCRGIAHTFSAVYSGDTKCTPRTGSLAYTINKAAPAIALVSNLNPSIVGQNVVFTATVSSAASTPTGSVVF